MHFARMRVTFIPTLPSSGRRSFGSRCRRRTFTGGYSKRGALGDSCSTRKFKIIYARFAQKIWHSGNPLFKVFTSTEGLGEWMRELGDYVVKADGLMGGKGVQVSGEHLKTIEEGIAFAEEGIKRFGRVVIEEKFIGEEFSFMSFVDGVHVVDMPAVQDHKRAYEGDTGPNTGGMGTYSDANHSLPFYGLPIWKRLTQLQWRSLRHFMKKPANTIKELCTGIYGREGWGSFD